MYNVGYGLRTDGMVWVVSGMGGWVGLQKLITFLAKSLDIRGEYIGLLISYNS